MDGINSALVLCGYSENPKGIAPRGKYKQLFARNELKLTVIGILHQAPAHADVAAPNDEVCGCSKNEGL